MSWYQPRPVDAGLSRHLVCSWTATVEGSHTLVPDGCVDVLWTSENAVRVCGPETHGWTFTLPAGTRAVGLRFRPGIVADALRVNVAELRDRRVPAEELLGTRAAGRLTERLADGASDEARLAVLEAEVTGWLGRAERDDPLARGISQALARRDWEVTELARAASLTERQLHRRCRAAFGYGPATLRAVLRLQRFMALARRSRSATLTDLAHRAGFSDHAHLARECRRIAGLTPTALLASEAPHWHGPGAPWWELGDAHSAEVRSVEVRSVQATSAARGHHHSHD